MSSEWTLEEILRVKREHERLDAHVVSAFQKLRDKVRAPRGYYLGFEISERDMTVQINYEIYDDHETLDFPLSFLWAEDTGKSWDEMVAEKQRKREESERLIQEAKLKEVATRAAARDEADRQLYEKLKARFEPTNKVKP